MSPARSETLLLQSPSVEGRKQEGRKQQDFLTEGFEAFKNRQWASAVQLWEQALENARTQQDEERELYSLCYLMRGHFNLAAYSQSLRYSEECLALATTVNDSRKQSQAIQTLIQLYRLVDERPQFVDDYQQLWVVATEMEVPSLAVNVLIGLGDAHSDRSAFNAAIETYQQALAQSQSLDDLTQSTRLLIRLGVAHYQIQDFDQAEHWQRQALAAAERNQDDNLQASALVNLGNIYRERGQYQNAIASLEQALSLRSRIDGDELEEGTIYGNLGNLYQDLGHYNIAIEYQKKSLETTERINSQPPQVSALTARVLNSLGAIHSDRGDSQNKDYAQAIDYFNQSLAISQATDNRRSQAETLNNLGSVYHRQLQYKTAQDFYERGLELAQTIGDRGLIADALADIGFVNEGLQNYPIALDYYRQGIDALKAIQDKRAVARALNNQAHTLLVWAAQERANGDENTAMKRLQVAETSLQEATTLLTELWQTLDSDLDRVSLFDTQQMSYNLTQQVLIAQSPEQNAALALQSSEEGRGRAFAQVLSEKFGHVLQPPTPEAIQAIAKTRNITLVEYAIMPRDDVIHQGKHTGKAGKIYIWVVQPTGDIRFASVDLTRQNIDLEALVQGSRDSIGARNRGLAVVSVSQQTKNKQQLKDLYNLLIAPIQQWLPPEATDKVVFIPHRELFLVPFAALQNPDGDYLIQHHTPVTAPSIQLLDLTRQQREAIQNTDSNQNLSGDNVLIVGNPDMPKYWNGYSLAELSGLSNAQIEANIISRQFQSDPFIGAEATERDIVARMGSAGLIHLATHGLLEYRNGNPTEPQEFPGAIALTATRSALSATRSNTSELRTNHPEDGLLTATEISTLTLQAQLVVLSACDTGRGDLSGDGVLGIARALMTAGSPSLLVSLWSVPDAPTSLLMQHFYQHWQTADMDKAQALRQAMLDTLDTHPNPNAWAAFTLIGEFE